MFRLDTLSPVLPKLSDKHQTVQEVSLNPPARKARVLGEAGQLPARETFEDGTSEAPADQPLSGKAREHPDGNIGNQWRSTSAMTTARLAIRPNPARTCTASSREK